VDYRADCARCEGLCCVSLPFDRSEAFSFEKAADVPCRYLLRTNRCRVHAELRERGLSGCANYDCYGAGQHITGKFLRRRSWRDDAAFAKLVFEAFRSLKRLHELGALLERAERLELPEPDEERRRRLLSEIAACASLSLEALAAVAIENVEREAFAFLRSLRHTFRRPGESPCIHGRTAHKPNA
jgi:hypothetical protein